MPSLVAFVYFCRGFPLDCFSVFPGRSRVAFHAALVIHFYAFEHSVERNRAARSRLV